MSVFYGPPRSEPGKDAGLLYGRRRRWSSRSRKVAILTCQATQPQEILEMDLMSLSANSLADELDLSLVRDEASMFPFVSVTM